MRFLAAIALASAVAGTCLACQNDNNSTLTPVLATPNPKPETFTGTVPVGGADTHNFTVSVSGTATVNLSSIVGPLPLIFMGVGIGNPASAGSTTCVLIPGASTNAQAGPNAQLTGTLVAGSYCVAVYDIGNETTPVMYTVTVTHS